VARFGCLWERRGWHGLFGGKGGSDGLVGGKGGSDGLLAGKESWTGFWREKRVGRVFGGKGAWGRAFGGKRELDGLLAGKESWTGFWRKTMPRKITLTVDEADREIISLNDMILTCKDMVAKNRYTARRSRLLRHVHLHTNRDKAWKQALVIVHLRSQNQILRGMLLQMGAKVSNLDSATAPGATGVDTLGMKSEWLDDFSSEPVTVPELSYENVISSSAGLGDDGDIDDELLDEMTEVANGRIYVGAELQEAGQTRSFPKESNDTDWNASQDSVDIFRGSLQ
jgi:hypothetical protein